MSESEVGSILQIKGVSRVCSENTAASDGLLLNNLNIDIKESKFLDIADYQTMVKPF
ncbi:MAG TPA: hypothetical protein VFI73_02035 [Candidatus Nitrosopolaris sp.]|nr:hypothetical protein [Candidatus Nitrosopolaris sp.]